MEASFDVKGLEDLEKALLKVEAQVAFKALRKSGREAMKPVRDEMAERANFNPLGLGKHLNKDIAMKARKPGRKSSKTALTVTVGPRKAQSQKAIAQEYGTSNQAADPFMRPALANNVQSILSTLKVAIRRNLEAIKNGN